MVQNSLAGSMSAGLSLYSGVSDAVTGWAGSSRYMQRFQWIAVGLTTYSLS